MFEVCHTMSLPLFLRLGKTPGCKIACIEPVNNHLEQRLENSGFLIDEVSVNGSFKLISTKGRNDIAKIMTSSKPGPQIRKGFL